MITAVWPCPLTPKSAIASGTGKRHGGYNFRFQISNFKFMISNFRFMIYDLKFEIISVPLKWDELNN